MAEEIDAKETVEDSSSYSPVETEDGLVSTIEYQVPEEPDEDAGTQDDADDTDADDSDGAEQNTPEGSDSKDFHEHPRFKELIDEKNALKAKLAEIEQQVVPPQKGDEKDSPTYQDIMGMEDESIVDEFTNNPKKFLQNYAQQLFHEFSSVMTQKQMEQYQQHQQTVQQKTLEDSLKNFFEARPDGQEMLKNGEIQRFIQQNPGHNAFSAYHELTREKSIQSEVEKARKAERDRVLKELKAKGHARSHASGPTGNTLNESRAPELKNPDKYGGRNNVLLERMRRRMAGT